LRPEDRWEGRRINRPEKENRFLKGSRTGPTLVALAAGVGSRYGGFKQLEPVGPCGETLLEYSVYDALRAGFSRVVLVVRPETETLFREAFAEGMGGHVSITYVHQTLSNLPDGFELPTNRTKPWGTGQAVLAAESEVGEAFAVVNADDFYGAESYSTLARFLTETRQTDVPTFAMLGFRVGQTLTDAGPASRALCQLDDDGRLHRIIEIAKMWKRNGGGTYLDNDERVVAVRGDELVSMNMWGFTRKLFPELENRFERFLVGLGALGESEFLLPEVIQSLIGERQIQVEVLRQTGQWCGITFPKDRRRVSNFISTLVGSGEYPEELWA